jgi:uncharacterized membrane protein
MKTSKIAWHVLYWTANLLIVLWAHIFLMRSIYHFPKLLDYAFSENNFDITMVIVELNFIILSIMFLIVVLKFRQLLKNLKNDLTFIDSNISLLKKITIGLIIFDLIHIFHHTFIQLTFTDVKGDHVPHMIPFQVSVIFFALLMWGLRHILLNGVRLKQENDLTI